MESGRSARGVALLGLGVNAFALAIYASTVVVIFYEMLAYPWLFLWNYPYFATLLAMLTLGFIFGIVLPILAYPRMTFETKNTAAVLLVICGAISLLSLGGLFTGIGGLFLIIAGAIISFLEPPKSVPYKSLPWETATEPTPAPDTGASGGFVTPSGARYCVACGAELEGNESKCPVCGTAIK